MPDTYTADCSSAELQKLARDNGNWLTFRGETVVIETQESLTPPIEHNVSTVRLLAVGEGETVPLRTASPATVAIITRWDQMGRFKAS
jgi:hypothetical protein